MSNHRILASPSVQEFREDQLGIVYFSRGNGRAQALTDIEIAKTLSRLQPDSKLLFVSYATGADTFRQNGYSVVDLGLPESPSSFEVFVRVAKIIQEVRPKVVISHEEFAVLPASKIFGVPTILITHWFVEPAHLVTQTLDYADKVVFIEESGLFDEPPNARGKVDYVGPAVRSFLYSRNDCQQARQELGLSEKGLVLLVLHGTKGKFAPILDLVEPAFDALKTADKHVIWLADRDYGVIQKRLGKRQDVTVMETDWQIDRLMVASDLVISKATHNTALELLMLGIPSISILWRTSPSSQLCLDELFTRRNAMAKILEADGLTWQRLAACLRRSLASARSEPNRPEAFPRMGTMKRASEVAASFILEMRGFNWRHLTASAGHSLAWYSRNSPVPYRSAPCSLPTANGIECAAESIVAFLGERFSAPGTCAPD